MLSASLKITVNKDSSVPLREQLVEQIALLIASGSLYPKEKLPSIRALAKKLSIHHSTITAAYNHLEEAGLLEIRQGSGVRVADKKPSHGTKSTQNKLSLLCQDFLGKALETGFSLSDIRHELEQIFALPAIDQILIIDRNEDFHPILQAGLADCFSIPIKTLTAEELCSDSRLLSSALIITSRYHLSAIQHLPITPARLVVCNIEPGRKEQELFKSMKTGSLCLIVSVSSTLLKMATNMAAALRGEEIVVKCLETSEESEIKFMLKHADAIICDSPSYQFLKQSVPAKIPLQVFHIYSESTILAIENRLAAWDELCQNSAEKC